MTTQCIPSTIIHTLIRYQQPGKATTAIHFPTLHSEGSESHATAAGWLPYVGTSRRSPVAAAVLLHIQLRPVHYRNFCAALWVIIYMAVLPPTLNQFLPKRGDYIDLRKTTRHVLLCG